MSHWRYITSDPSTERCTCNHCAHTRPLPSSAVYQQGRTYREPKKVSPGKAGLVTNPSRFTVGAIVGLANKLTRSVTTFRVPKGTVTEIGPRSEAPVLSEKKMKDPSARGRNVHSGA